MKTFEIDEIVEILPQDRTKFLYYKDKYAVDLLRFVADGVSVAEVKNSRFSGLLKKPVIQHELSSIGGRRLRSSDFEDLWVDHFAPFLLTLGYWGKDKHREQYWYQTTSRDANLVLQLNFSNYHNSVYRKCIQDEREKRPFEYFGHPIAREPYRTLARARIDLDFETGEALIEEIQSDWVRYGASTKERLRKRGDALSREDRQVLHYLDNVLPFYSKIWREAMLSATLWFLYAELGIARIFYHRHESGIRLKRIEGEGPPRSIYEELPRKFCFKDVGDRPGFLESEFRRVKFEPAFYSLDFSKGLDLC